MRHTFITIVLILLGSVMHTSCNTSRRAARQIDRITEQHPELLQADTVRIDTLLYIAPCSDTAVIDLEKITSDDSCVAMDAAHGTFTVEKLSSRQFQIIYTPDTTTFRYRQSIPIEKIIIQKQEPWWKTALATMVFLFVFMLVLAYLIGNLKKILQK